MTEEVKEQTISLLDQIKEVARARILAQQASEAKMAAWVQWNNEHRGLLDTAVNTAKVVEEAEALLRELTLKAYDETGSKTPAPGVGIRERTVLQYDGKVAFDWAKAHKIALMLDTKAFEKIAKADPPNFVKTITEPQATIATDLSKVLEVKEE